MLEQQSRSIAAELLWFQHCVSVSLRRPEYYAVAQRHRALTLGELDYASANLAVWFLGAGPGPDEIVKRLNGENKMARPLPDIRVRFISVDNIPPSSSPEQFAGLIRSEY